MSRRNPPTLGSHPDLFNIGGTPIVKKVSDVPREELMTSKRAQFSQEEWDDELDDEIREAVYENDEDSKTRREVLKRTLVGILGLDDESRAAYAQQFVDSDPEDYISDNFEQYIDKARERDLFAEVNRHYEDVINTLLEKYSEDDVAKALKNYHNYRFETEIGGEEYRRPAQFIYAYFEGDREEQIEYNNIVESYENDYYSPDVERHRGLAHPFPDEVYYVIQEELVGDINNEDKFAGTLAAHFSGNTKGSARFASYDYRVTVDVWYGYVPDFDKIKEDLGEAAVPRIEDTRTPEERVIYKFKDGFYIQDLIPSELDAEGEALGICVGREDMPYERLVRQGKIKILSLRTAAGRPKFTIEAETDPDTGEILSIDQVKGKSNRLPGFSDYNLDVKNFKPTEVEMIRDWISTLDIDPSQVRDMKPGLEVLEKRQLGPKKNPVSLEFLPPVRCCSFCDRAELLRLSLR